MSEEQQQPTPIEPKVPANSEELETEWEQSTDTESTAKDFGAAIASDEILEPEFQETWWERVLDKIRSILPQSWNEKLSDLALTSILAGIVVLLILIPVFLSPQKPKEQIAKTPSSEVKKQPEAKAPPAKPKPTPEQNYIAAIKDGVGEIISQYKDELIVTIKPNYLASSLIIELDDDWYKLSPSRQDEIANTMLSNSEKIDFRKLEITDSEGTLLARSPVVGKDIVILQRQK